MVSQEGRYLIFIFNMDILVVLLLGETNLTRKLKLYSPKINIRRKAVVGLARRTRSRHWFVTLVLL